MCIRQISLLHQYLRQVSNLMCQQIKQALERGNKVTQKNAVNQMNARLLHQALLVQKNVESI